MISRRTVPPLLALWPMLLGAMISGTAETARAEMDGKVVVAAQKAPWQAVGRLNVAGFRARRHCTATLIAPDVALTARHCLGGFLGEEWIAPERVHFLPGYTRGRYLEHRRAVAFEPVGTEAVLVRLDGRATVPPFPVASERPAPGTALFEAGYSGDKGHVLTVDPACRFLGWSEDGFWQHDCRAIGGDSGAPILVDTGEGLAIAAIHVGRRGTTGIAEPLDLSRIRGQAQR